MTIRSLSASIFVQFVILLSCLFPANSKALAQRSDGMSSEFLKTYGLAVSDAVAKLDMTPLVVDPDGGLAEIKIGPKLLDDAKRVFRGGNQPLATELFFAHTVAEYDQAQEALRAIRFSPSLRRPVWQVQWGVSLALRGGDASNANPIPTEGRSTGRGAESESGNASSVLESALGLVATTFADEFTASVEAGNFGEMVGLIDSADLNEPVSQPRSSRQSQPEEGDESSPLDAAEEIFRTAPTPPVMWHPGIVFLGEAASTETLKLARELGIDFLVHFDVALKMDREEKVENDSRCRIIQVADGKMLAVSKGIDHDEAERFSRGGRGNASDYVEEQLAQVFVVLSQKSKVSDMPTLSEDVAKKRVAALISAAPLPGASRISLRAMAEIRFYQSMGLLQQSEVDAAMDYLGGDEALFLIHGSLDERLQRARQWAVDALPAESSQ